MDENVIVYVEFLGFCQVLLANESLESYKMIGNLTWTHLVDEDMMVIVPWLERECIPMLLVNKIAEGKSELDKKLGSCQRPRKT